MKPLVILASLVPFVVGLMYFTIFADSAKSHDIDHCQTTLNFAGIAFTQAEANAVMAITQVYPTQKLHWDGVIVEGTYCSELMKRDEVLINGTPGITGGKFRDLNRDFWHERRNIVDVLQRLAYIMGRAKMRAEMQNWTTPLPFYDYDPFKTGVEPHYPELVTFYNTYASSWGLPQFGIDWLRISYKDFEFCQNTHPEHSYRCRLPERGEGGFNYYDRMPQNPPGSGIHYYLDGKFGTDEQGAWQRVLEYANAHREAGMFHLNILKRRLLYAWSLESVIASKGMQ